MAKELLERHREKRKNAVKKPTQSTRKRKVVAFDNLMPPPENQGTIKEV
jgi:hypothetical protein